MASLERDLEHGNEQENRSPEPSGECLLEARRLQAEQEQTVPQAPDSARLLYHPKIEKTS